MNKRTAISIISVLAIGAIVAWVLYFQETDKVKDTQAEIFSLEGNVSTLETDLAATEAEVSALEAELAATRGAYGVLVDIINSVFKPQVITVPVSTTVTWVQLDSVEHTVTSGEGIFEGDGIFHSDLAFGQTFSYTFTEPGDFQYFCDNHDSMTGRVIVE